MTFAENTNAATDKLGKCPICEAKESKIIYGWHGVYYDMMCPNEHLWEYRPQKQEGPKDS